MKKAKKKSEIVQAPEPVIEVTDADIVIDVEPQEPPVLKLTREELLEFRALEAEMEIENLKAQLLVLQKKNYIKQIDPLDNLSKFTEEIKAASAKASELGKTRQDVRAKIQERLGIDLDKYAYDDATGELRAVDL